MNTETGEIKEFKAGEAIPANFVPLGNQPRVDCQICGGKGSTRRLVRVARTFQYKYTPCACTNPEPVSADGR